MKDYVKTNSRQFTYHWFQGRWLLLVALMASLGAFAASYYLSHNPLIPCACSIHQQASENAAKTPLIKQQR